MRCRGCNTDVSVAAGERVGFRDECDSCGTDLHTCEHCIHYDPSAYNECRESGAERVIDKDRANRCDWFSAGEGGGKAAAAKDQHLSDLDALFKK
jgi:hypothetical protein